MENKKHLAVVSILIKDRQSHAPDVNRLLSEYGHLILARLGVNVARACLDHCSGLISVVVEGGAAEIHELTKKLDDLYGIVAKSSIMTE